MSIARQPYAPVPGRSRLTLWQLAGLTALVPVVLICIACWLGGEYRRAELARQAVNTSYERRFEINELLSQVTDAETAQRGYVITAEDTFLAPYAPARARVQAHIVRLRELFDGRAAQQQRLTVLEKIIGDKFEEMAEVLAARNQRGREEAVARISSGYGRDLMDQARRIVDQMNVDEQRALSADLAREHDRTRWTQHVIWMLFGLTAVLAITGAYATWRSRSEHDRLEGEARNASMRLHAIFDSTIDAVFTLNPSGTIETFNSAAQHMFGYAATELDRRDISVLFDIAPGSGSFAERIGLIDGVLRKPMIGELEGRCKSGDIIPIDVALGTMPLPDGMHLVAAVRDISERKQVERLKEEFVSTVSHELRTPLTSVVGSLGLLRNGTAGDLPDAAQRLVDIAENNSRRLIRLINDILDIDKMGSGKMRFENAPLDLRDVAAQAIEASSGMAQTRGVSLVLPAHEQALTVRGDIDRLVQVATNLLSNAVRFTPVGGEVRLSLTESAGRGVLCVTDQGPGVPDEFRDRIFSRFSQASNVTSQGGGSGGTGLGLAISREIIRNHDGRIWFEDAAGGGTTFAFELALWQPIARDGSASARVLICEDDGDAAGMIRMMLATANFSADIVTNTEDAVAYAQTGRYAALLVDMHLPDGSGLNAVRVLRTMPETQDLPVIVISGRRPQDAGEELSATADIIDWIEKPIDHRRLVRAIQSALDRADGTRPTLLHIDDDNDLREVTATAIAGHGRVVGANSLASARAILALQAPDIVILDIGLPDGSGLDLLSELIDAKGLAIPTIIYSAQDVTADTSWQVDAVLVKSRRSLPNLAGTIRRILDHKQAIANL